MHYVISKGHVLYLVTSQQKWKRTTLSHLVTSRTGHCRCILVNSIIIPEKGQNTALSWLCLAWDTYSNRPLCMLQVTIWWEGITCAYMKIVGRKNKKGKLKADKLMVYLCGWICVWQAFGLLFLCVLSLQIDVVVQWVDPLFIDWYWLVWGGLFDPVTSSCEFHKNAQYIKLYQTLNKLSVCLLWHCELWLIQ